MLKVILLMAALWALAPACSKKPVLYPNEHSKRAISGNVGGGIATGAASGAAVGLFFGLFKAFEPSAAYKNFVNECLIEKGYKPVGWN